MEGRIMEEGGQVAANGTAAVSEGGQEVWRPGRVNGEKEGNKGEG